jgi:hypothetical protein
MAGSDWKDGLGEPQRGPCWLGAPRGCSPSVVALQEAINHFVAAHNRDRKPFVWQADPDVIIVAAG